MDPIMAAMAVSTALQGVSAVAGLAAGHPDRKRAEAALEAAWAEYQGVRTPQLDEMLAQQVGPSHLNDVAEDGALRAHEDKVLGRLSGIVDAGGLDAQARADMEQAAMDAAGQEKAQRDALLSRYGTSSGAALAAQLQAQQSGANRAHAGGMQAVAGGEARALDAMSGLASLSGSMQNRYLGRKTAAASADDAIARYNADARTSAAVENNRLRQQAYENEMALRDRRAGVQMDRAAHYEGRAAEKRQMWGAMGQAAGGAAMAAGTYYANKKPATPKKPGTP